MNFYQFYDKLNGEPYSDERDPSPVKYNFWDYPFQTSGHELKPLTQDDIKTTSAKDAAEWYAKHGKDTTKLGDQMTDDELRKFGGLE